MICPNCQSQIDDNAHYCNYCGENISHTDSEKKHKEKKSNEDYIQAYMGCHGQKNPNHFSIIALVFGPIYLLYKKMYIPGILLLGLISIISYYSPELALLVTIIINLILGFKFHDLYREHATKKVDEIKISNPDKSSAEILAICQQKGKPLLLVVIACCILVFTFITTVLYLIITKPAETKETITGESIGHLTYQIPKGFQSGSYNNEAYKSYHYIHDNNKCSIRITIEKNIGLNQYIEIYIPKSEDNTTNLQTIHSEDWVYKHITYPTREEDNYLIKKEDILYHVSYNTDKTEFCNNARQEFISSLIFE